MSTIKANQWLSSDGTENYKCKAFVNFNGTGTVAIRASGNVSSITDNGVGIYTVNFTNAMVDANYNISTSGGYKSGVNAVSIGIDTGLSIDIQTTRVKLVCTCATVANDFDYCNVAIFR